MRTWIEAWEPLSNDGLGTAPPFSYPTKALKVASYTLSTMKTIFSIAVLILSFSAITWAQQGPPPAQQGPPPPKPSSPVSPDYTPYLWKEYSFEDDGVRFKFPAQPQREDVTVEAGNYPTHAFTRESYMMFQLVVSTAPKEKNLEGDANVLEGAYNSELNYLKSHNLDPKIVKNESVIVDGHAAGF